MKSAASSVLCLILLAANVAANVENEYAFDEQLVGRLLGGEQDRHERQLFTSVPKQMYKELIYKEQGCQAFQLVNIRGDIRNLDGNNEPIEVTDFQLGDYASFKCDLFEDDIRFGMYGGRRVGDTFWGCQVIQFVDLRPRANPFDTFNEPVWDCTITDYIGADEDQDNFRGDDIDPSQLRNEGLTLFLFDPNIRDTSNWRRFHSHEGLFATTGGAGTGKGARGQMEVIYDDYKMTWIHIYTVEVWDLEQENFFSNYRGY